MAALKNHGYEVARVSLRDTLGTETTYDVVLSFRSDGHIMRRLKALNIHDTRFGGSAGHDYGWKLYKRLKDHKRDTVGRMKNLAVSTANAADRAGTLVDSTI